MVEIIVVLAITLILFGLGGKAINAVIAKRGVNGATSVVSSQISLARSISVARNRHVALLLPDPSDYTTQDNNSFKNLFCTNMRMCYVRSSEKDPNKFEFDSWIDEYDWVELPSSTCANFIEGDDKASTGSPKPKYNAMCIEKIPFDDKTVKSAGMVFAPSGRLAISTANGVMAQIFRAAKDKDGVPILSGYGDSCDWKNQNRGSFGKQRWCITIKKYTGRSEVNYAQPKS